MKFRTACPHCTSVFRLGPEQLDAAAGWVQCGVCGKPFDAFPALLQEDGSPLQLPETVAEPAVAPPLEPPPPAEAPAAASAEPSEPEPAHVPVGIAQREAPLDLPSIILIDPDQAPPEDLGPMPEIAPPVGLGMYPPPAAAPARPAATFAAAAAPAPAAQVEYAAAQAATPRPAPAKAARIRPARRSVTPLAWGILSVLLLAALLAQAAYFLRDTLASQFPQTRPALERACALLGCTLSLPRQLDQLRIVGSDLQTEATGRLRLSLTLGNRSAHTQAWPMLVLTLTDQRNRPLARRSFAPSEYLGDPRRVDAGMPPHSEHPLNLPLTVLDIKPMGFDLRLTY